MFCVYDKERVSEPTDTYTIKRGAIREHIYTKLIETGQYKVYRLNGFNWTCWRLLLYRRFLVNSSEFYLKS